MNKLKKALVVASKKQSCLELVTAASTLADDVVVVALAGEAAVGASKAYLLELSHSSVVMAASTVKSIVAKEAPQLLITEANRDGRLLSAVVAAENSTSVLTDCTDLWLEAGKVYAKRMSYGGKAFKTEYAEGSMAVVCLGYSIFPAAEDKGAECIEAVELLPTEGISFISREEKEVLKVNLGAAKKVVGIGRGVGDGSKLPQVEEFAKLLGAELACTRPVAEEEHLIPKERYVGVTGCTIKPDLYLALGISGVIQHMAGVNSSGTIIAVNRDKNAPIFANCDYGIVGDMFEVIKLLGNALSE